MCLSTVVTERVFYVCVSSIKQKICPANLHVVYVAVSVSVPDVKDGDVESVELLEISCK